MKTNLICVITLHLKQEGDECIILPECSSWSYPGLFPDTGTLHLHLCGKTALGERLSNRCLFSVQSVKAFLHSVKVFLMAQEKSF